MKRFNFLLTAICISSLAMVAQPGPSYWQQAVDYHIVVDLDHKAHSLTGDLTLVYTNNSPDVIDVVFFNLYWNAFQPGSMMSNMANIPTQFKDKAIGQNIEQLKPKQQGEQIVHSLSQDGQTMAFVVDQTILKAALISPLSPGESTVLHMTYTTRIPKLVERAGRDNPEGVDYTFTQWYPKLSVYDAQGWHPDIYVAREFYGDYGHFKVDITADAKFTIGGTGLLQNASEIGHGYSDKPVNHAKHARLTWTFEADNVHDFAWVADPDFIHDRVAMEDGPELHFFYQDNKKSRMYMDQLQVDLASYFRFMNGKFGSYEWPQFSVIQGGEGAMEYPMATIMQIHSKRYEGVLGTVIHEASHMWFYGMLGTDEMRYPWIDEGFTSFAEEEAMNHVTGANLPNAHLSDINRYAQIAGKGVMEPMSTLSNYYDGKFPYQLSAYMMGSLFLVQLQGIIGDEAFWTTMKRFKNEWLFKHPQPNDFLRIAEQESGMVLDWYLNQWVHTLKVPDVGIASVKGLGKNLTVVTLERHGSLALPVDVLVVYQTGQSITYTIPLSAMFGHKSSDNLAVAGPWNYTEKTFELVVQGNTDFIASIVVDPRMMTADVNRKDNEWQTTNPWPSAEDAMNE